MKKEFLAAAMVIGAAAALMSGCGKDKIVGEWTVSKIQLDGMTEPKPVEDVIREQAAQAPDATEEEIQQAFKMFEGIEMDFDEDGTVTVNHAGYGISGEGTWDKSSDGTYSISGAGDYTELTLEGGELIQRESGTEVLVYEKK